MKAISKNLLMVDFTETGIILSNLGKDCFYLDHHTKSFKEDNKNIYPFTLYLTNNNEVEKDITFEKIWNVFDRNGGNVYVLINKEDMTMELHYHNKEPIKIKCDKIRLENRKCEVDISSENTIFHRCRALKHEDISNDEFDFNKFVY